MTPTVAPVLAQHIELWPPDRLRAYPRNARTHSDEQVAQIAASIAHFGFVNPILVAADAGIVAGHGRLLAARKLGLAEVPVIVLDHLNETDRRALILADNKIALNAGWDEALLAEELRAIQSQAFSLATAGFSDAEVDALWADTAEPEEVPHVEEEVPEPPATPVTRKGDIWLVGPHRLICGDCRDPQALERLFGSGAGANVIITSPPYAAQRDYDRSSGFTPISEDEYLAWYCTVAHNLYRVLADDGSYFLNIKEHADGGERSLYVKDLVIAHRREWGWRFVDEFCWRKTDNGVPGGWGNRFKNAWEPVFHFSKQQHIKFRPKRVGHESEDCFDYSPNNPKSRSGSGLLGTGARGAAADGGKMQSAWQYTRNRIGHDSDGRHTGVARPSNVIEVKSESSQGSHSAPFPRQLVEFFLLAFTDPGDLTFDPFMGSGTTMAAAAVLDRVGYGSELSPAYCDVILHRMTNLTGQNPVLMEADGIMWACLVGKTFENVAVARGVPVDQALNPKDQDSRAIKHHGPNPCYGQRHKSNGASNLREERPDSIAITLQGTVISERAK